MKFLDQKEQVIDLQLTQHGKTLLSMGMFKPVYYAFGDDDVLYDSDYMSASYGENQSDIEPRIQEGTPRLSVQANYTSAEKWSKQLVSDPGSDPIVPVGNDGKGNSHDDPNTPLIGDKKDPKPPLDLKPDDWRYTFTHSLKEDPNKHTPIKFKLGTSSPLSDKLPAWRVAFLNGELSGSSYYYADTQEELHFIPQLDATIEYDIRTKILTDSTLSEIGEQDKIQEHPDNSYVNIQEDYILLRILEENVAFSKENYDVEVYEILNGGTELKALALSDSLTQGDDFLFFEQTLSEDPNDTEYYVELLADEEIDPELLIDVISKKVGSFYLDKDLKRIKARLRKTNTGRQDIYRSELESVEPCEE